MWGKTLKRILIDHRPAMVGMILVVGIVVVALAGPWFISAGLDQTFDAMHMVVMKPMKVGAMLYAT